MVDIFSPRQMTPLHWAAYEGKVGTVQILIENGADMNIKDNDGVREWVCIIDCVLVLLIRVYVVYDCVANPQSLVS